RRSSALRAYRATDRGPGDTTTACRAARRAACARQPPHRARRLPPSFYPCRKVSWFLSLQSRKSASAGDLRASKAHTSRNPRAAACRVRHHSPRPAAPAGVAEVDDETAMHAETPEPCCSPATDGWGRASWPGSQIESPLHHVPITHHVVLALHTDPALGLGLSHGTGLHQLVEGDDLRLDEAALEVGVDDAGGLGRCGSLGDGPGARFLGAGGEVGLQTERVEADAGQLVQARLLLTGGFEHLGGLVLVELDELGLELGVQEDR